MPRLRQSWSGQRIDPLDLTLKRRICLRLVGGDLNSECAAVGDIEVEVVHPLLTADVSRGEPHAVQQTLQQQGRPKLLRTLLAHLGPSFRDGEDLHPLFVRQHAAQLASAAHA